MFDVYQIHISFQELSMLTKTTGWPLASKTDKPMKIRHHISCRDKYWSTGESGNVLEITQHVSNVKEKKKLSMGWLEIQYRSHAGKIQKCYTCRKSHKNSVCVLNRNSGFSKMERSNSKWLRSSLLGRIKISIRGNFCVLSELACRILLLNFKRWLKISGYSVLCSLSTSKQRQ